MDVKAGLLGLISFSAAVKRLLFFPFFMVFVAAPALAASNQSGALLETPCIGLVPATKVNIATQEVYLWRAEKDGKATHFLGTWHVGVSLNDLPEWFSDGLMSRFQTVVVESDTRIKATDSPSSAKLEANIKLSQLISEEAMNAVVERLKPIANREQLERMKPFAVALLIGAMPRRNFTQGIDNDLIHFTAERKDMQLLFLENLEEISDQLDQGTDTQSLLEELEKSEIQSYVESIVQIDEYRSGRYKLDPSYPITKYGGNLVYRHRNWIDRIVQIHNENSNVLVAVGVNHLLSEDSVLDLLKQRGFKITRMKGNL